MKSGARSRKPVPRADRTIAEIFDDDRVIAAALRKGTQTALRAHKLAGNPVAAWKDGRVVWIQPEEIPVSIEPRRPKR